jgi:AraC family transcriptional regulator
MSVYYDDPADVPETELRSRVCVTVSKPCELEPPLERVIVAGGEYAIFRHKGSYSGLTAAYQWIFGTWLLQSGRALRDAPVIDEYYNSPINTSPCDLLTDICIPLA